MQKTVHYLYDPLCGWCYGANPAVAKLSATPNIHVSPLPSGLFSGKGARKMDAMLAQHAWLNDQRIATLSKQSFSPVYKEQVLGNYQQLFDSSRASLALSAVALTNPSKELFALHAIQLARYVDGQDITDKTTLNLILDSCNLIDAKAIFVKDETALIQFHQARIDKAKQLISSLSVKGVPQLIYEKNEVFLLLDMQKAYTDPSLLLEQINLF